MNTSGLRWALDDPVRGHMVFVGCSRRKSETSKPIPALDLYQGGCVPPLRDRLGKDLRLRSRIRILSAEYGLLRADTPLLPYDRPLDDERAEELRPHVGAMLRAEFARDGVPRAVLVMADPLYLGLIDELTSRKDLRPDVTVFPNHQTAWPDAAAVLDTWGWGAEQH